MSGSEHFPRLFSPIVLGPRAAPNRIASTAHQSRLSSENAHIDYHAAKLRGGVGTDVVFATTSVHPTSSPSEDGSLSGWDDDCVGIFERTVRGLREVSEETLLLCQLTHRGRRSGSESGAWLPALAPSSVGDEIVATVPKELTAPEIEELVEAFGKAAARVRRGGFDGVEILAAYGHLVDQFWSPGVNERTDEYDLPRGTRFALEVLRAVRDSVGPDMVVGVKLAGDDLLPDGVGPEQAVAVARAIAGSGAVDYLNVIGGTGMERVVRARAIPGIEQPHGVYAHLAAEIRAATGLPIVATARIVRPEEAEQLLAAGDCDQVSMTRPIMSDPDMPRKARAGQLTRIRYCTGCNEGCIGRNYEGRSIICIQNPILTRERELAPHPEPAARRRHVVVVGGGLAGLETARSAAERGHAVILLERKAELGGAVRIAAVAPKREEYHENADWLIREIDRLGVDVRTGGEADADTILDLEPDVVVLATGARTWHPDVPGATREDVYDVEDVLERQLSLPGRVVVVEEDSYVKGLSVADWCAAGGSEVTLVSRWYFAGHRAPDMVRVPIYERLAQRGVKMEANLRLRSIGEDQVRLQSVFGGPDVEFDYDHVVLSYAGRPHDPLGPVLAEAGLEVVHVGDCVAPRSVAAAILDGMRAGRML
jgi:2,4-dienoyl-CoA reductase-like NADH-dependent reductase (Old Yellow Enzyme family)/thioredoxin reductase